LRMKKYEDLGFFQGDHDLKEDFIATAVKWIDETRDDIAAYENPFKDWVDKEKPIAELNKLQLVDGGMADQNIPIEPFLQDSRHVDAIFAFDNSKDTESRWPDGRSLFATYERAKMEADLWGGKVRMPPVPSPAGFVNSGLNTRPVFFGCEDKEVPTIIYIPNYSWSTMSNTDTFKLDYSLEQTLAMIENGRRALDLNGTVPDWGRCLTCAMYVI
jgi:lysophospholipase